MMEPGDISPEDLEEVEVRKRPANAVISARIPVETAERIATLARGAGVSVSEFARRALIETAERSWRINGIGSVGGTVVGPPPVTGGAYSRVDDDDRVTA